MARELARVTQRHAATAIDTDPSTLISWEQGKRKIPAVGLFALAKLYGVDLNTFAGERFELAIVSRPNIDMELVQVLEGDFGDIDDLGAVPKGELQADYQPT
jgi:transcriptional regulator with XRE-family HTH domain